MIARNIITNVNVLARSKGRIKDLYGCRLMFTKGSIWLTEPENLCRSTKFKIGISLPGLPRVLDPAGRVETNHSKIKTILTQIQSLQIFVEFTIKYPQTNTQVHN